jgi:membrane-associated phospholipid phosphatase
MTYTLRHGPKWWPWLITALVGTSVAIERVLAGQHFPTDVLLGAAAGAAVGWLVPWLHARARGAVSIAPVQHGGAAVMWSGRL